jgi:hypothetical protein
MQVNALIRRESDRYGQVYRQAFANALIYGESVMVSAHHSKIVTLR